ncbi:MAG TPA: hypothetical protein PLP33_29230 [Leptospiraceae bacterium]|nr:hypothetical protein [Leptospiraceae bacterium]
MKQYTFDEMINRTSLIPSMLAETILEKANYRLDIYRDFILSCDKRVLDHYNNNEDFRKKLTNSKSRREILKGFILHWLRAFNKNENQYLVSIGYAVEVSFCGNCDQFHKVEYYGDCRNNAERFSDVEDAMKRLNKKVIEVD